MIQSRFQRLGQAGCFLFALSLFSASAPAASTAAIGGFCWDGSNGNWDTDGSWWIGFTEPTAGDDADIDFGTVTVDKTGEVADQLRVGLSSPAGGTLQILGGGTLSNTAGFIGYNTGSLGAVTVNGAGSTWTNSGNLYVGKSGEGSLGIGDGGTVTSFAGLIADESAGTVTVTGAGSTWTIANELRIGKSGYGSFNVEDGGAVTNTSGFIGLEAGPVAFVTVKGTGSTWTNTTDLYVGGTDTIAGGTVLFWIQDGGEVRVLDTLKIWDTGGGETTLDGGILTVGSVDQASIALLNFIAGTFNLTNDDLDIGPAGIFGNTPVFSTGQAVNITHNTTFQPGGSLTVSGGSFTTGGPELSVSDATLLVETGGSVSNATGYIGKDAGTIGTATVTGAGSTWTNANELRFGEFGDGTLNVEAGGAVTNTIGRIGINPGSTGTATVTGAGSTWTNSGILEVGREGDGTLNIEDGGAVSNTTGYIGVNSNSMSTATVNGPGSMWTNTSELRIGEFANGTLNVEAGGAATNTAGRLGVSPGSTGTANITGTGSTWASSGILEVGRDGNGTLNINAQGAVSNATGYIGRLATSTSTATVAGAGSTWTNANELRIGEFGEGTLNVQDSGTVTNTTGRLGVNTGSTGTATVTGAGSTWSNSGDLHVGDYGNGALYIQDGGTVTGDYGRIGYQSGSTGSVEVSGLGSSWIHNSAITVGASGGQGTLNIYGGGRVSTSTHMNIGNSAGEGVVTVSGEESTLTANGSSGILVGRDHGTGTLIIENGGNVISSRGRLGEDIGSTGEVTVSGAGSTWTITDDLYVGGTLGVISHGTLTIQDGGQVTSIDTYIGDRISSTGAVTVTGTGSLLASSGDMHIGGALQGTLIVGGGGLVNVGGAMNMDTDAALGFELDGPSPGKIDVTGLMTADGILNVTLLNAFAPTDGISFDLLDFSSITGSFDTLNLPALASGLDWDTSNLMIDGTLSVFSISTLTGDLDNDGFVGINDLNIVLGNWNQNVPPGNPLADPSGDGFVGIDDLNAVLGNWNAGIPPTTQSNIPEPTSLIAMASLGWAAVLTRRSMHS